MHFPPTIGQERRFRGDTQIDIPVAHIRFIDDGADDGDRRQAIIKSDMGGIDAGQGGLVTAAAEQGDGDEDQEGGGAAAAGGAPQEQPREQQRGAAGQPASQGEGKLRGQPDAGEPGDGRHYKPHWVPR